MRPRPPKHPAKAAGFTWGRRIDGGLITWRLFRRDHSRKIHEYQVQVGESADASYTAHLLRLARRRLRDQVDTVDLRAMGCGA